MKVTQSDLLHGTMTFFAKTPYEAVRFQEIAFDAGLQWHKDAHIYRTTEWEKGIVIESGKLYPKKKKLDVSQVHQFSFDELDPALCIEKDKISIEHIYDQYIFFMPKSIEESLILQHHLLSIGINFASGGKGVYANPTYVTEGLHLNRGYINHKMDGYHYLFLDMNRLPDAPLSPQMAQMFNLVSTQQKIIEDLTKEVKAQGEMIRELHEQNNAPAFKGFTK